MDIVVIIIAAGVSGALGLVIGRSRGRGQGLVEGRAEIEVRLRSVSEALARGDLPDGATTGTPEAELRHALEKSWAPKEHERARALREAVGRVGSFLDKNVRGPLSECGPDAGQDELRERIAKALGALQDLDFVVSEAGEAREGTDLTALAQRVSREFAADHAVSVRLRLAGPGIRAVVNASGLMDALYLVLHNAARFGGGSTVDLGVSSEDGRVKISVRDRGPGFSEEAFMRAFDPFYSTSADGLGLGLPHARKSIESMGGRIELRNVPDGGAEVEISFPGT